MTFYVVDHVALSVSDLARSRKFYGAALAPLGFSEMYEKWEMVGFGAGDRDDFGIFRRDPPTSAAHVAFAAPSREAVDAFYEAALSAGGRDNGPPGLRRQYHAGYYAAFVLDPDGNNIEAVHHSREEEDDRT
jgi:catechol 2,3-dioxygenase-like lactoylglutathione lyase family enzyme